MEDDTWLSRREENGAEPGAAEGDVPRGSDSKDPAQVIQRLPRLKRPGGRGMLYMYACVRECLRQVSQQEGGLGDDGER